MAGDGPIVINDGGGGLTRRERQTKSGIKARYTVTVKAEPLIHDLDAKSLGKGPAQAIADHLRSRLQSITRRASDATLRARERAGKALAAGETWAARRYAGGRIGTMPPNQSDRMFNDSGRFAAGLVANASADDAWTINVPANRLDPATAGGDTGVQQIWQKLVGLVPEFGDASKLTTVLGVRRAIKDGVAQAIQRERAREEALTEAEKRAAGARIRAVLTLIKAIAA